MGRPPIAHHRPARGDPVQPSSVPWADPFTVVVRADEQVEHFADGPLTVDRVPERQIFLDPIPVATTSLLLDHVAGVDEVGDDGVGSALGDPGNGGDVPEARSGSSAMHSSALAWFVRKLQLPISTL